MAILADCDLLGSMADAMKMYVGKDVLEPVYYERKGFWYISRNGRETIYNEDREWVTFDQFKHGESFRGIKHRELMIDDVDQLLIYLAGMNISYATYTPS